MMKAMSQNRNRNRYVQPVVMRCERLARLGKTVLVLAVPIWHGHLNPILKGTDMERRQVVLPQRAIQNQKFKKVLKQMTLIKLKSKWEHFATVKNLIGNTYHQDQHYKIVFQVDGH